jgi:hypothetical protein
MKADAKHTFEDVATALCKGAAPPDWVIAKLRKYAAFVADTAEDQGDEIDRLLLKSALHLQRLLPLYTIRTYEMIGEEYPDCIDTLDRALDELLPILAEGVERPKRGPKRDLDRHLCAAVCMDIWREHHGEPQPHSPKLWEACEAYWLACGREGYSSGHIKNWEDYLLANIDHPLIAPK